MAAGGGTGEREGRAVCVRGIGPRGGARRSRARCHACGGKMEVRHLLSEEIEQRINVLNTMVHHRIEVQAALQSIIQALERRSLVHDVSKFREDEFEGFARINGIARRYPYGSEEYRASLKAERPIIDTHYARNSHHPEAHKPGTMGILDIVEMVCDWHAAWRVYDGQRPRELRSSWRENLEKQRERFVTSGQLTEAQWWVVRGVAALLGGVEEGE